ncbi:MAG: DNA recombination protein RmuC, partial [Patiriisocius sp.]
MNEIGLFIILTTVCLLVGAYIGNILARIKSKSEISKLEERLFQNASQEEKLNERFKNVLREREDI